MKGTTVAGGLARAGRRLAALVWGLAAMPVLAAVQDDFLRGQQAYHRGDVVGAMAALRPAALAGHASSQVLLAFILDRADFADEAARFYREAAAQGDAEGHAGLANAFITGRGVAKDEKQAALHFSKAADLGHRPSIEVLASAWLAGQMGLDARADPVAARTALLRAAERGHLASTEALGKAYQQGLYGLPADAAQAALWQARGAELRKQRLGAAAARASR